MDLICTSKCGGDWPTGLAWNVKSLFTNFTSHDARSRAGIRSPLCNLKVRKKSRREDWLS